MIKSELHVVVAMFVEYIRNSGLLSRKNISSQPLANDKSCYKVADQVICIKLLSAAITPFLSNSLDILLNIVIGYTADDRC